MGRIYIDVEENPNCGYHPMQTFETQTAEREVAELWVPGVSGADGPHMLVGWCSENSGGPCPLTLVEVTDSGAAVSLLVVGGDPTADLNALWDVRDVYKGGRRVERPV